MDIEKYRNYCISKKGVTESFPFPSLPNVLVFKVAGKMFTATDVTTFESISVQCHPEYIDELRAKYAAVTKHKYFSERHWNVVAMDHSISDKLILEWIDGSYESAIGKLTKKAQVEFRSSK
jgi:predicted DNA-binding protein (MmcQ/YjbR family)